jgi:hypothetical protein
MITDEQVRLLRKKMSEGETQVTAGQRRCDRLLQGAAS